MVYITPGKGKEHAWMDIHVQKDSYPFAHTLTNNLVHRRGYALMIYLVDKVWIHTQSSLNQLSDCSKQWEEPTPHFGT